MIFVSYANQIFILILIIICSMNAGTPTKCYGAQLVLDGLKSPLAVDFINNHTMIIAEQLGIIMLFDSKENKLKLFLNLTDRILTTNKIREERGLLGLTLDPNFKTNGYLYVFYSSQSRNPLYDHDSVVSSFQTKWNNNADKKGIDALETEMLRVEQPHSRQNGGQLFFGDDGYLYITTGDGGDMKNSRFKKESLLGKILRINIRVKSKHHNYTIPEDNPFINETNSRAEVYAYGFRNPWRCTVDRKQINIKVPYSTQILCGDNGEPNRNEEDLYLIESGGRYGWLDDPMAPCHTIKSCQSMAHLLPENDHLPIHSYSRAEGQAVISGIVYRGHQFPELEGQFIFADYVHGTFHTLHNIRGNWTTREMCVQYPSGCKTDMPNQKCPHILGIVANAKNEVFILSKTKMNHDGPKGTIYKLSAPYKPNSAIIYNSPFIMYIITAVNLLTVKY